MLARFAVFGRCPPCCVTGLLIALSLVSAISAAEVRTAQSARGMVVAVEPQAVEIGASVLKRGGSAVDAAVAVALALAVTHPEAGNIGGGGFMLVRPLGEPPVCIDYRETAPAAATRDMFALDESRFGCKIVGVPGTIRGLELAHQKFGRLPWRELVLPAVHLAEDGFDVDAYLAKSLNEVLAEEDTAPFAEFRRVFAPPDSKSWRAGDRLVQRDLAMTLQRIADEGPDALYRSETAERIVAEMKSGGGIITAADLTAYRAEVRRAVHGTYRGYDVYGAPPPSSGGVALVELLNILERFDLKQHGRWSPRTQHLLIESLRRAFLDRARHVGDPAFIKLPQELLSKDYAAKLARGIDLDRATPSESLAPDIPLAPEGDDTTHFSILDEGGMAVANTYTLEYSYGSRVVVRGAGFLLNNQMGDFNWKEGHTDRSGNVGTAPNLIEPGKRMVSSQSPTMLLKDGKLVLITGSPGGRTILGTVLSVVVNTVDFQMPPAEAVAAPRLHHQWLPNRVRFEGLSDPSQRETVRRLEGMGHVFEQPPDYVQGDAHSIFVDPVAKHITGVADGRRNGAVEGY